MSDAGYAWALGVLMGVVFALWLGLAYANSQTDRAWPVCAAATAQVVEAAGGFAVCERPDGSLIALRVGSPK